MSKGTKHQHITALAFNKRGRLLSVGINSYTKTHPTMAKYAKLAGKPDAIYLHAEVAALLKAREQVYRLVVLRYNKDGTEACAAPCKACQLALKDHGVTIIQHT